MNKTFLLLLLACFSLSALGQPVLNNTYLPEVGKAFSGRNLVNITAPILIPTGPNQNWDFTSMQSHYNTVYSFGFRVKQAAAAQGAPQFPGAEKAIVSYFGEDSIETFYKQAGTDLQRMGFKIKNIAWTEKFSVPRVDFRTGHEFQEFSFRESASVENLPGVDPQYFKYYDTVQYAGYGTMTTTFGTYTNVPLIVRRFGKYFSDSPNGTYSPHLFARHWYWYLPGFGVPYIQYSEEIYAIEPETVYYDGYIGFIPSVGTLPAMGGVAETVLFPNVLSNGETLRIQGIGSEKVPYTLFDMGGRKVTEGLFADQQTRLSSLAGGVYRMAVETRSGVVHHKLVVK